MEATYFGPRDGDYLLVPPRAFPEWQDIVAGRCPSFNRTVPVNSVDPLYQLRSGAAPQRPIPKPSTRR